MGMNPNLREMFSDSPFFQDTVDWCEQFDAPSFDPYYPMLPLSAFEGALQRVFSLPQFWWNPSHPKAGAVSSKQTGITEAAETTIVCDNTWTCHGASKS